MEQWQGKKRTSQWIKESHEVVTEHVQSMFRVCSEYDQERSGAAKQTLGDAITETEPDTLQPFTSSLSTSRSFNFQAKQEAKQGLLSRS